PSGLARTSRSMRQIDRTVSLHAQGKVFQLKYLAHQADSLLEDIDDLIAATERAAPVRTKQPYVLTREAAGAPVNEEARWERAIWADWHRSSASEFVPGVCSSIVSYQVMLRDTNSDKRWGEVDLLGRSPEGWPVVIELKGASSNEPPLRGIVEGVAYAIAIRKAWAVCLVDQWRDVLGVAKPGDCTVQTIFAAPSAYWDRVTGRLGPKWRVPKPAWAEIARLIKAFAERQLPVFLVCLDAVDSKTPRGISASMVDIGSLG